MNFKLRIQQNNKISWLLSKNKHETIFLNTKNSGTNEPQKFVLNLS